MAKTLIGQYGGTPDSPIRMNVYSDGTTEPAGSGNYSAGAGNANSMPYSEQQYTDAVNNNSIISKYIAKGNSASDIEYAVSTGDYSGLVNEYGQPFSLDQQQEALSKAQEDIEGYYESLKTKETQDAENALAQKQADYQQYLLTSGQQFAEDKTKADQSAVDRGVLFSGSRVQKEKNLQRAYEQDQAYQQGNLQRSMASTAQDYAYKYGDKAAKSLSDYYKAGSNTYNANVARNGVTSNGLSSLYKPISYGYGGTRVAEQTSEAQKRAAKLLANQGNKLLATGYSNQF